MNHRLGFGLRILAGSLLLSGLVRAEVAPDAGQLLERSQEPLRVQPLEIPRIELPPTAPAAATQDGLLIPVRELRISGATIFPINVLHALVAEAEGRELSFIELQGLALRLTQHYREHGYLLARAYLPPQEIRDGVVEIAVLEGHVEAVLTEDAAGLPPHLQRALMSALTPGRPLQRAALERTVLLYDTLPGIAAGARLRAGDTAGGTVVVMESREAQPWSAEAALDNHGDRYTGEHQAALRLDWNNLAGGDQLGLSLQGTGEGRAYGRLAYDFPLAGLWRGTAAASSTRYELGEEFRRLDADGRAHAASLEARYPLLLRPTLRLHASMAAEHMRLLDRIRFTATERDKSLNAARLGLSLQATDRWRGLSALSLQLVAGELDLHDADEAAQDATTVGSAGGFGKLTLAGERRQALPLQLQLRATASLQQAFGNLASVQKFAIGGAQGVRAYPSGEAQGDDGRLLTLELQRALPLAMKAAPLAIVFADYGRVRFNHRLWDGFRGDTTRELAAAGLGLEWQGARGLGLSAYQAWPLTDTPVQSEPDSNHRFWLQLRWRH